MKSCAVSGPSGTLEEEDSKGASVKYPNWSMPLVAVLVVAFAFGMCILAWALQQDASGGGLFYTQLAITGATLSISCAFVLVIVSGMMARKPRPVVPPSGERAG